MFHLLLSLLFLLMSTNFVLVTSTTPYPTFNGYQAMELTGNITERFTLETQLWSRYSVAQSNVSTNCGGYLLLGGYGILSPNGFFQRKYTALPSHNMIYFQLRTFIIDDWQTSDGFIFQFDNKNIIPQNLKKVKSTAESSNVCGQQTVKDLKWYTLIGKISHSKKTLTLNVKSNISSTPDIASFGFREISLVFANASTPLTEQVCFRSTDNAIYNLAGECPCPRGTYVNSTNSQSCLSCDSSCSDCFGPSAHECYVCKDGYSSVGNECIKCDDSCNTCSGPGAEQCVTCKAGFWLHPNSTCSANCSYPDFAKEEVGDFRVCNVPCATNEYLLWNQTCGSACSDPYIQETLYNVKYCNLPCQSNEFLYWNSTCQEACNAPLVTSTVDGNLSLCNPPCLNTTDYYYPDGSCLPTCAAPMTQNNGSDILACEFPCQSNEYLAGNDSCLSSCDSPYVTSQESNVSLCSPPCPNQYLFIDGSCVSTCNTPFIIKAKDDFSLCQSPCSNSSYYFYPSENTCKPTCQAPNITTNNTFIKICEKGVDTNTTQPNQGGQEGNQGSQGGSGIPAKTGEIAQSTEKAAIIGLTAKSLTSSSGSNTLSTVAMAKMFQYIRYMKINYPAKLTKMLGEQNVNSLSISLSPDIPENVEEKFTKYPLPAKFDQYGVHSSFLVNFWEELFTITVVLFIVVASSMITPHVKKYKYLYLFFNRTKLITKWDFFILVVASNYDGIVLFSSLEFRTVHFDSFQAIFSFLICIIMNILGIYIFAKTFYVVRDIYKARFKVFDFPKNKDSRHDPAEKWKTCQILFINFKENSFSQYAFMVFFLVRICLFNAIISYLFNYPLLQAIFITIMSTIMLVYLAIKRPIKKKFDMFQLYINEVLLFIVNVNVCIFAIADTLELEANSFRITVEDIIIVSNLVFSLLTIIFLGIEVLVGLFKGIQAFRESKAKGLRALAHTLFILCEQDGLNIEEHDTPPDSIQMITSPGHPKSLLSPGSNVDSIFLNANNNMNSSFQYTPGPEPDSTTKALTSRPAVLSGFATRKISDITTGPSVSSPMDISPVKLGDAPSPMNIVVIPSPCASIDRRKCSAEEDFESKSQLGSLVVDTMGTLKELDVPRSSLLSITGQYRSRIRLQLAKTRGLRLGSSNLSTKEEIESKNELSAKEGVITKSPHWRSTELGKVFFKKESVDILEEKEDKKEKGSVMESSIEVKSVDEVSEKKRRNIKRSNNNVE